MRIHLQLSPNRELVPFDHLPVLVGAFHKWLGKNELHEKLSLHSFSWLQGSKAGKQGLRFAEGARWFISAYDETVIRQLVQGIMDSPEVAWGMRVKDIRLQPTPNFGSEARFAVASPVLVKRSHGEETKHYLYSDPQTDDYLTETLRHKLRKAGLPETAEIAFDRSYAQAHTKLVNYRGIQNRANVCPVIIKGTPETIAFAWEVGAGNSTGIGLGALK